MRYNITEAIEVLERTPAVLHALLNDLNDAWLLPNEGPDTFSPYDVVGHLIHGEKADWTERIKKIVDHGNTQPFEIFDRFAMYEASIGKSIRQLLNEFKTLREANIKWFKTLHLTEADLERKGLHPMLGEVTLRNLLSTWVIHDLTHIGQISRVMAKQYKEEMGPWIEFFRIMEF
ncbi:MAG: DinB family protein [Ferruginibacter sp.]